MKAILLSRVSTEEQRGALSAQTFRLEEYVQRLAFAPVETIEFDESAYKLDRKEFNERIVKPIEASNGTVALVCDKIDRLLRNYGPELTKLEALRTEGKLELHFPSDNVVLTRHSPATDLFRFSIGISLAKYYSDSIRDNVKRRFEQMARDGKLFTRAPLGYTNVLRPDGTKWVEVDETRRLLILRAFELRANSLSYDVIAKTLNEEGLRSKSSKPQPLTGSRMEELLSNPFYAGFMLYNGNLTPHQYEQVVPTSLFEEVQRVRDERHFRRLKTVGKEFLFKGLIRCDFCGYSVACDQKKNRYTYLKCTQYGGKCEAKRTTEEILEKQVSVLLKELVIPREAIELVLDDLNKDLAAEETHIKQIRRTLMQDRETISSRLAVMYEDRLDGRLDKAAYDALAKKYKSDLASIEVELAKPTSNPATTLRNAQEIMALATRSSELFLSQSSKLEDKRAILKTILSNLKLRGEKLLFNLDAPFDTILECNKTNQWYRWSDSNRHDREVEGF